MKNLDIMELCSMQALLIRYRNELVCTDMQAIDESDADIADRDNAVNSITSALDTVMDDIAYRAEQ
ncbi:MAG: hypothetical protein RR338_00265 [Clostridia bacterium]